MFRESTRRYNGAKSEQNWQIGRSAREKRAHGGQTEASLWA
ncbi:hypothetical protein THTE_4046 [Thermogutta terrifontis]|uniref:Uncharacterized protein n=1 Tax=Thermogutta terrifontis TaxID=1331910 RepID=A0A286RL47_9BACT|nr:hypothetical protein THTE_4046 [Thermogutta terrifontis]